MDRQRVRPESLGHRHLRLTLTEVAVVLVVQSLATIEIVLIVALIRGWG